jgi:hypothetical protein
LTATMPQIILPWESLLYRSHFSLAGDKLDFKVFIFIWRMKINYYI